jgi:hypothetical protein
MLKEILNKQQPANIPKFFIAKMFKLLNSFRQSVKPYGRETFYEIINGVFNQVFFQLDFVDESQYFVHIGSSLLYYTL